MANHPPRVFLVSGMRQLQQNLYPAHQSQPSSPHLLSEWHEAGATVPTRGGIRGLTVLDTLPDLFVEFV